jgi:hypothetical protein
MQRCSSAPGSGISEPRRDPCYLQRAPKFLSASKNWCHFSRAVRPQQSCRNFHDRRWGKSRSVRTQVIGVLEALGSDEQHLQRPLRHLLPSGLPACLISTRFFRRRPLDRSRDSSSQRSQTKRLDRETRSQLAGLFIRKALRQDARVYFSTWRRHGFPASPACRRYERVRVNAHAAPTGDDG